MTDPAEKPAPPRWKVTWRSLVSLLLLLVGIAGSLYLHQSWRERADRNASSLPLLPTGVWDHPARATLPASAPVSQRLVAMLPEGMTPLAGNPMALPPPAGFVRQSGFCRGMGGLSYEVANYRGGADMDGVVRHYRSLLESLGLALLGDQTAPDGARTVIFTKEQTKAILRLHKNRRQENIIEVLVTAIRPAGN